MFNHKDLIYIITVAETGNITRAARKLFISQPSLSQTIQKIEDTLGQILFVRHRSGVELTDAGRQYYEMAIQVLNMYRDMENEILDAENLKKGSIRIGCSSHMGSVVFPAILPDFIFDYPNIDIKIKEDSSNIIESKLYSYELDLAIMHYNPLKKSDSLDYYDLTKDNFIIIGKKNGILSKIIFREDGLNYINLKDVKDEDFILLPKGRGIREIADLIADSSGVSLKIKLESINFMTNIGIARTGAALSIVPFHYFNIYGVEKEDLDWAYIKNPYSYWNTCIAVNKDIYLSAATKEIIERLKSYFERAAII